MMAVYRCRRCRDDPCVLVVPSDLAPISCPYAFASEDRLNCVWERMEDKD